MGNDGDLSPKLSDGDVNDNELNRQMSRGRERWQTALLTASAGSRARTVSSLSDADVRRQLERLFARTTKVALLQRFLDPDALVYAAKGLHKGLFGSAYNALAMGASLVFGRSSMGMFADAYSLGQFVQRFASRELNRIRKRLLGTQAHEWSEWQTKWADFLLSVGTVSFGLVAAHKLWPHQHLIGTALLGASAVTTSLTRFVQRRETIRDGSPHIREQTVFYCQLVLATFSMFAQRRLKAYVLSPQRSGNFLCLFGVLDLVSAPLLVMERILNRYANMIFTLQFNV